MLERLDHVRVAVRDLDQAARDQAALLGRRPRPLAAGVRFELAPAEQGAAGGPGLVLCALPGGSRSAKRAEGMQALVFACADPDACAHALRRAGVGFAERPRQGTLVLDARATRGVGIEIAAADALTRERGDQVEAAPPPDGAARLDHAVVLTPDHGAALRLYGEVLGLRLALDRGFEARGLRILFFRIAGVTVEVAGPLAPGREAVGAPDRFGGLAWRGDDVDAWRERLLRDGFDVSKVRAGFKPGTRVCTVRDRTHGVPTLLIAPDPESDTPG